MEIVKGNSPSNPVLAATLGSDNQSATGEVQPVSIGGDSKPPITLVKLRPDLDMYPGTTSLEGYPTYVIHDRFRHQFTNIGHTEYEILKRWHLGSVEAIVENIYETTTLYVNEEDVTFLNDYLLRKELAVVETEEQRETITSAADKPKKFTPLSIFKMFMLNISLFRPDTFLTNTYWMIKFVFTKPFWWFMFVLFLAGGFLVIRDLESFTLAARAIFTFQGATFIIISLVISKAFHELGHAYTCKHLGLAVPKFGLRLMIILPFFYTDTNESWKLNSRRKRFLIGAGGVLSECTLAIVSMFLWGILDDGFLRSICFYLFVTSWLSSLAINMTPFLKWDGYYMFSDLIGIQNLQMRGFKLGKWQLREWLFKWEDEIPLKLTPTMHKVVVGYAYGAWIKRFFIFLAIGILIYQKLFKVLGIFMLTMQVYMFIVKPVSNELIAWYQNKDKMNWNTHSITTLLVFCGILAVLFIPWQTTIRIPAAIAPRVEAVLYTPDNAQVAQVAVTKNQIVRKGDLIVQLKNTNLEYDIRLAKSDVDILENSLNRFGDQSLLESRAVLQEELQAAVERTSGLIDTFKRLKIVSPFDGEVTAIQETLLPGTWVGKDTAIASITDKSSLEIYGYIPEKDLTRIDPSVPAIFYPENPKIDPIQATVIEVDQSETRQLKHGMLSYIEGGSMLTTSNSGRGYIPKKSYYRVRLAMLPEDIDSVGISLRGSVHLGGEKHSIAADIYRRAVSILIRESGF